MTDFYDVEKLLTSLGIGEAAITVLSPRGIPTPLAATRLVAPDSQMAPVSDERFAAILQQSALNTKYSAVVDRHSAYEMINARLDAARRVAANQVIAAGVPPTTATGMNSMTPAQQRREIQREVREARAAERAAERERKAQAAAEKRWRTEQARAERARQRSIDNAIRTGGRVATSRLGQDILRGVFGTILGGGRK